MEISLLFAQLREFESLIDPQLVLPNLSLVQLKLVDNLKIDSIDRVVLPSDLQQAVKKRKLEFLLGRYCASRALSYFNVSIKLLERNQDRTPHWPIGYVGSISHTDNQAIACVAKEVNYSAIGIDIERIIAEDFYPALKKYVIMPSELVLINEKVDYDKLMLATLLFSAKESLYKLLFKKTTVTLDFNSVSLVNLNQKFFSLQLNHDIDEKYKKGDLIKGRYVIDDDTVITLLVDSDNMLDIYSRDV